MTGPILVDLKRRGSSQISCWTSTGKRVVRDFQELRSMRFGSTQTLAAGGCPTFFKTNRSKAWTAPPSTARNLCSRLRARQRGGLPRPDLHAMDITRLASGLAQHCRQSALGDQAAVIKMRELVRLGCARISPTRQTCERQAALATVRC